MQADVEIAIIVPRHACTKLALLMAAPPSRAQCNAMATTLASDRSERSPCYFSPRGRLTSTTRVASPTHVAHRGAESKDGVLVEDSVGRPQSDRLTVRW